MNIDAPEPGLYVGRTIHARPDGKSWFAYRIFSIFLDIDDLNSNSNITINGPGFLSFYERDHGARINSPIRPWADGVFREAGIDLEGGPIRILAMPRIFGFVFNPISLFFGYRSDGRLCGVIYEVNNTFGETHCYVAQLTSTGIQRHTAEKTFHVSPFFDVAGQYEFQLQAPAEAFSLKITKTRDGSPDHVAVWTARRQPLNRRNLLKAFLNSPFLTFWVVFSIHWQALRLWLRGAVYHSKPAPPKSSATKAKQAEPECQRRDFSSGY